MKTLALALLALAVTPTLAGAQATPQPLKPSATYVKYLRRYQAIQAKKAAEQRKLLEKQLAADIEAAGLQAFLSRICNAPAETDCVPRGYGVDPNLELFTPLPPAPPAPTPAPPAPTPAPPAPKENPADKAPAPTTDYKID